MTSLSDLESLEPIAVVGMSCRFPGAPDVDAFWTNLRDGLCSIREFSEAELRAAGVDPVLFRQPGYVPAHGSIDDAECFDAAFFEISAREAEIMDPQHRLFLECAWAAIEAAGYDPESVGERFGVVAGSGLNGYLLQNLLPAREAANASDLYSLFVANDKDFLSTRVSYKLNLRGPSLNVNTACSSSLVAVQVACQLLWSYQCDGALAGGVSLQVPQHAGYLYQPGGIASPDGRARAFDAAANGTVTGSGVGAVVLKRLADARAAGDTIHALIRGIATNNDGALKAGYTAPSIEGQAAAIAEAAALAGIDPATIGYVEAHGTGTPLGDPIEVAALTQAYGPPATGVRRIGSVKSNIGHLDAAAGVAGLIKAVLALRQEAIPPSLHFQAPNAAIDFESGGFAVCTALTPWPRTSLPRRAGVSSFGIGGTNAHAVLEESPAEPERPVRSGPFLFVLSARSPAALQRTIERLAAHLERRPARPEDVAWTLAAGRKTFRHAAFAVAASTAELVRILRTASLATGERTPSKQRAPSAAASFEALTAVGEAWLAGATVDWPALFAREQPRRVPLPSYPFERTRHWVEPQRDAVLPAEPAPQGERSFFVPSWTEPAPLLEAPSGSLAGSWLVFARETPLERSIVAQLEERGAAIALVPPGLTDFAPFLDTLRQGGRFPERVLHLWTLGEAEAADVQEAGFNTLLRLMRALAQMNCTVREIAVVTSGLAEVHGHERLDPWKASLLGPVSVIPEESPGTSCRCIDLDLEDDADRAAANLMRELGHPAQTPLAAWRGGRRWTPHLAPLELPALANEARPFRRHGSYLITGGLGGLGLIIAEHLATTAHADLTLVSRRALPPPEQWEHLAGRARRRSSVGLPLAELAPEIARLEAQIEAGLAIRSVVDRPGLLETANALAAAYALDYFRRCGAFSGNERRVERAQIYAACSVLPEFRRLVDHLLNLLSRAGWIRIEGERVEVVRDLESAAPAETLRQQACREHPAFAAMFDLLATCAGSYGDALSGRIPAVSVLFPDGGRGRIVEAAERVEEHGNHRVYRTLLAEVLRRLAEGPAERPFRILEIGGGNAIMTGLIAERLRDLKVEYVFTDIGLSFVLAAKAKARELGYEFMSFATFDISRDPAEQGFEPGSFDAVIGLDVVHATPSIRETVANLRSLLAPGGLLALVESARTYAWNDMVWGLAEGWWAFQDPELRNENSPLLSTAAWERALAGCGFTAVRAFPEAPAARARTDCSLILAQSGDPAARAEAGEAEPAGSDAGLFAALVRIRKSARSLAVRRADVADEAAMSRVLAEAEARGAIDGVIHAAAVEHKALIASRERPVEEAEFRPKVLGTLVLERLFRDRPLDFMVLCSSITAVVGGAGQVGYCAANAFLDAFAVRRSRERRDFTVSIDWGRWQGVGLARDFESWHHSRTGRELQGGMTVAEGLEALERILVHRVGPRVAVVPAEWRPAARGPSNGALAEPARSLPAPATDAAAIERQLAQIWCSILGTPEFDRQATFQELGGDSLIGIQMIARIREQLGVQLPIHAVFDSPTVDALALRIVREQAVEMEEGSL